MKNSNLHNNILPKLISGDINKSECVDLILEEFSDYNSLHSDLHEGEEIIYQGNKGKLIEIGRTKSIIQYQIMGKVVNENTNPTIEVYNIEFYKTPKGYWD